MDRERRGWRYAAVNRRTPFQATSSGSLLPIAGHARSRGLAVVTGNLGEFRSVDGLRCEDWLDETEERWTAD